MMIQKRLNTLLDESPPAFGTSLVPGDTAGYWTPVVDCYETDDKYAITAELPGVLREDIDLQVRGRKIVLSGKRKLGQGIPKENYHRVECATGKFQRTFEFSSEIDESRIDAQLTDGVLRVTLPKQTSSSRLIHIERRD
ncbi:MAG: Hsp20/alpha crystallin family protein [Terriglobia bacterium]